MERNPNIDKDKKSESGEEKSVSDLCCCYVIDPCGCYVNACGCYVNPCCCC
jgi:hypothetical protein